jgi:hypothetical protein
MTSVLPDGNIPVSNVVFHFTAGAIVGIGVDADFAVVNDIVVRFTEARQEGV